VGGLFARELGGKSVWAVPRPGHNGQADYVATSVMLLDCARLTHWRFNRTLADLFAGRFDYVQWMELRREDRGSIGHLRPEWNSFDRLTPRTKLLHTTKRRTQPWQTGLPVKYTVREKGGLLDGLRRLRVRRHGRHPLQNQEALVYSLLAEMVDAGEVGRAGLEGDMAANHIRHDSPALVDRWRGWKMAAAA